MTSNILNSNDNSNQLNLEPKKISQENNTQLSQTRRKKISSRPPDDVLKKFNPGSSNKAFQIPSKFREAISIKKPNENKKIIPISPNNKDKDICSPQVVTTGCQAVPKSGPA